MCMKYRAICFDFVYTLGDCTDSIVAGLTSLTVMPPAVTMASSNGR